MGRPEQAAAMLPAFRRLAEEHGNVLTKAYALLSDGALEGPAATALFTGIAQHHQSTRHAFLGAFDQLYRLALLSQNPPRSITLPYLPRPPAGPPRASDQVLSGNPEHLDKLAAELTRAGNSWERAGKAVSRHLSGLSLNPAAGHSITQAGTWLTSQRPGLTRRRDQLLQSDTPPLSTPPPTGTAS